MKKFSLIIVAVLAAFATVSCEKEGRAPETGKEYSLTIHAGDKPQIDDIIALSSKTYLDGETIKWSASEEYLKVLEVATKSDESTELQSVKSNEGATEDGGTTMTFGATLTSKSEGYSAFDYYAVYPNSAVVSNPTDIANVAINTPASQTPLATSFDPAADLLLAKKQSNGASQAKELNMQFTRVVSIGAMTIKNLNTEEPIQKVTFSAKKGENAVDIAGRTAFNLSTGEPKTSYASNTKEHNIVLDCSGLNIVANTATGVPVYFTSYPFTLSDGDSFKVVVETTTKVYTKEVSLSGEQQLAFKVGKRSSFGVNFSDISSEEKAFNGCYAFLEYADVESELGSSYSTVSVTKTHGDIWEANATKVSSSIGLKKDDASSYIKLPEFAENISTVVVTLAAAGGNGLTIDSAQNDRTGDIANVNYTEGQFVYTIDLSSAAVKTAYIHSTGGQSHIAKVEVYAGTDTREAIGAPASVIAALNEDDAEVTNSIDVSWDAVTGAAGYVITVSDGENEDKVVKADASPFTVTGLLYETEYLVTVQAEPADYYLNKISAGTTSDVVATGAQPATAQVFELYSGELTSGSYVIVYEQAAMNTTVNSDRLQFTEVTPDNGKILNPDETIVWTISASGDYWTIYNESLKQFAVSTGAKNKAGMSQTNDDKAKWAVSSNANTTVYDFVNKQNTNNKVNAYLRKNGTYGFACYANSTGGALTLYKLVDNRQAAGMSWSKESTSASIEDGGVTFTAPTLSNPNSVSPVTYESTDTDVAEVSTAGEVTVKAGGETTIRAIFAGDDNYKPQTVEYTLTVTDNRTPVVSYDFETVAELNALVTSTADEYSGYLTNAVVSFVPATNTAIVKDATGSVMIYKSSHGLKQGQTYTGAINVTAIKYNSLYSEITVWDATFTGAEATVSPESVSLADLIDNYDDYQNAYVQVAGLTVSSVDDKNIHVTDGTNSYVVYDNTSSVSVSAGDVITAIGTITKYKTTEEIKVWKAADVTVTASAPKAITFSQPEAGGSFTVKVDGNTITSGTTVASGKTVTLTATAATDYSFNSWNVNGATVDDASASTTTFVMGASAVTVSASFSSTTSGGTEVNASLTKDEITTNITKAKCAYGTEKTYTDTEDGIVWKVDCYTDAASRPWMQMKSGSGYIHITADGAISSVTLSISNATNKSGGIADISKHGDFTGTVSLSTAKSSGTVLASGTPSNKSITLQPSGSNTDVFILVSGAVRVWGIDVTYNN